MEFCEKSNISIKTNLLKDARESVLLNGSKLLKLKQKRENTPIELTWLERLNRLWRTRMIKNIEELFAFENQAGLSPKSSTGPT
jgi:hypothetical protein